MIITCGGELFFCDDFMNSKKILEFKPPSGSVIFFDALQIHGTNPIISGVKYSDTNFYTLEL